MSSEEFIIQSTCEALKIIANHNKKSLEQAYDALKAKDSSLMEEVSRLVVKSAISLSCMVAVELYK